MKMNKHGTFDWENERTVSILLFALQFSIKYHRITDWCSVFSHRVKRVSIAQIKIGEIEGIPNSTGVDFIAFIKIKQFRISSWAFFIGDNSGIAVYAASETGECNGTQNIIFS